MEQKRPYLSATQLQMFMKCPEQYRRRYLEKQVLPPSVALVKGSCLHLGAEHNFKQKIESKQDLDLATVQGIVASAFEDTFKNEYVELSAEEKEIGKDKVIGQTKDSVVLGGVPVLMRDIAPKYQPIAVESAFTVEIPSSTHDLLVKTDIEDLDGVMDIKTSTKSKSQGDADKSVQLTAYYIGYLKKYGRRPKYLRFEQVIMGKKLFNSGVIDTARDDNDVMAFAARMSTILKGIKSGIFPPCDPSNWWCSERFCGYHATCKYVKH